jgi:hypothetical protein
MTDNFEKEPDALEVETDLKQGKSRLELIHFLRLRADATDDEIAEALQKLKDEGGEIDEYYTQPRYNEAA